jgi:hypothetical protein
MATGYLLMQSGSPEGVYDSERGQSYKDTATGDTYTKTTAAGTLTGWRREILRTDQRPRNMASSWLRNNAIAQTFPRIGTALNATPLAPTSGTLYLSGGVVLPAGVLVSNITFLSNAAAASPTNQWFCIVRCSTNAIAAKTVDDTTTAWGAGASKTLAISGGYTPTSDEMVWIGVVQAATTPATLERLGTTPNDFLRSQAPFTFGSASPTGLTTPASLASITSVASISSGGLGPVWAEVS